MQTNKQIHRFASDTHFMDYSVQWPCVMFCNPVNIFA